jgi:alginate lyase
MFNRIAVPLLFAFAFSACAPIASPTPAPAPTVSARASPTTQQSIDATVQRPADSTPRPTGSSTTQPPRTFLIDPRALAAIKSKIAEGTKSYDAPLAKLVRDAESALKQGPFTVISKTRAPASGDMHDYFSQAPYYWPDPTRPDGLPYINRDGERNPEIDTIGDARSMELMLSASQTLALAYFFKADDRYAERAALVLRVWFLDPRTRMNPNMNYAQAVPGRSEGTAGGIIDSHNLPQVLDAVGLLERSKAWSAEDDRGMRDWFSQYLDWMMNSKNGLAEAKAENNHGSYYDAQIVSIALFLNREELAKRVLEEAKTKRIARQIEPDGRQPLELRRTKSWDYAVFNLQALFRLAILGDRVGIDLWNYRTADGRGLRQALDWLVPFALGSQPWTGQQIVKFEPGLLTPQIRQAAASYNNAAYREMYIKLSSSDPNNRLNLTTPLE